MGVEVGAGVGVLTGDDDGAGDADDVAVGAGVGVDLVPVDGSVPLPPEAPPHPVTKSSDTAHNTPVSL